MSQFLDPDECPKELLASLRSICAEDAEGFFSQNLSAVMVEGGDLTHIRHYDLPTGIKLQLTLKLDLIEP